MKFYIKYLLLTLVLFSCDDFLEEKPSKDIVVPTNLEDLQAIIDNNGVMNLTTGLATLSADEQTLTDIGWAALASEIERNAYIWADNFFAGESFTAEWDTPFRVIYYSNVVLDQLSNLDQSTNMADYNNVRGSALFFRAYANYQLLELFTPAYDKTQASGVLGVPIKNTPFIDEAFDRGSQQDSFDHLMADLEEAYGLLPETALFKTRPSKLVVDALRARIYFDIGEYGLAESYAEKVLAKSSELIDFNTLTTAGLISFPRFSSEVIFHSYTIAYSYRTNVNLVVRKDLYDSFQDNDLRKSIYFRIRQGNVNFFGNLTGNLALFTGFSVSEMMLISAEAKARIDNFDGAMTIMNRLLSSRWLAGTYTPFEVENDQVLGFVEEERQKEMMFRGRRWIDIKRLNSEGRGIVLNRNLNGVVYTLQPNDPKYAFPIPDIEIRVNGLEQNPR